MTFAVVPAAGKSTRMGRQKLALAVGERTVLERVIDALRNGGVNHVVVVLGPKGVELASSAERAGANTLVLVEQTAHMRDTVEAGLEFLRERYHPGADDPWLLAPADHPMLSPTVTASLIDAGRRDPAHSIFIPTYCHRRGHPVLFLWKHAVALREFPSEHGLNAYVRACGAQVCELPVSTENILLDMDTMEDYERLRRLTWPVEK